MLRTTCAPSTARLPTARAKSGPVGARFHAPSRVDGASRLRRLSLPPVGLASRVPRVRMHTVRRGMTRGRDDRQQTPNRGIRIEKRCALRRQGGDRARAALRFFCPPPPPPTVLSKKLRRPSKTMHWRATFLAVIVALRVPCHEVTFVLWRLARNALLSDAVPAAPAPRHGRGAECLADVARDTTIVVTAKDTCAQAPAALVHLSTRVPAGTRVVYYKPTFQGCDAVDLAPARLALPSLEIVDAQPDASPVDGFIDALRTAKTPYALLMHNDVYAMDAHTICELVGAAVRRPESSVFAPQLYEREATGVLAPHAHQTKLRNESGSITFDMDRALLLDRWPSDFSERAQRHFLEDHAYLVRTNVPAFLDRRASYTYEYVDNVLTLRALGIVPHFVPTARFLFDVDARKISWHDVAYLSSKRSEAVGHDTCQYLTQKWDSTFHPSGVWNYVRASYLWSVSFEASQLPTERHQQLLLYYAWFMSIGYSEVSERARHVVVSRTATSAPLGAHSVSLPVSWLPIQTSYSDSCAPDDCGMLLVDAERCHCWTYEPPFDMRAVAPVERLLDALRLPARAARFEAMRRGLRAAQEDAQCAADESCAMLIPAFADGARLVRWAWRARE